MTGEPVDVAILGGGMAGISAALEARGAAPGSCCSSPARSAAPESRGGCIPTKALVRAAEIAHDVTHRASEFGIRVSGAEVDFAAVMARVRRVIDEGTDYYERLLAERGVDLVRLPARLRRPERARGGRSPRSASATR